MRRYIRPLSYRILLRKEPDEGYTVIVPSIPGCVANKENIEEAIDAKEEFVEEYVFPLVEANGCYEW